MCKPYTYLHKPVDILAARVEKSWFENPPTDLFDVFPGLKLDPKNFTARVPEGDFSHHVWREQIVLIEQWILLDDDAHRYSIMFDDEFNAHWEKT